MRSPYARLLTLLVGVTVIFVPACGEGDTSSARSEADKIVSEARAEADRIRSEAETEQEVSSDSAEPADESEQGGLPDMTGKGLQFAQDSAQEAGFFNLTSHDATGRGREQLWDRNWKVCNQTPKAGTTDTSSEVDFGTVKIEESCPSRDQGRDEIAEAGATMPNLVGKSGAAAEDALPSASIDFEDGTGAGRVVIVASNWKVCSHSPSAGEPYGGVPVTLTVVKYGEGC